MQRTGLFIMGGQRKSAVISESRKLTAFSYLCCYWQPLGPQSHESFPGESLLAWLLNCLTRTRGAASLGSKCLQGSTIAWVAKLRPAPSGCMPNYPGTFGIAVMNVTGPGAPAQAPVTSVADGQPQASTGAAPVTTIADGQPQVSTGVAPVSTIADGQPQAPTSTVAPVATIADGQPQATTMMPINQIGDGQIQNTVPVVSTIADGQPQAPTGAPVSTIADGQPQAPTGAPVSTIADGQPQAPTGAPVSTIADGQPQAPTGAPVSTIADGQPQAPTGAPVSTIADGQPQAPTGAPVSTIADGQPQAPTGAPVSTIADGQPQAPTGAPVSTIADGQPQAPTGAPVTTIADGQPQAPTGTVGAQPDGQPTASAAADMFDPSAVDLTMVACQADDSLQVTLEGGVLTDNQGRTGYIASNYQFQFDGPPQAGAIYTAGWSVCGNGSLALGGSAVFYQCLSGDFYNLYDRNWAAQCNAITINAVALQSC